MTDNSNDPQPIVKSAQAARGGVISGRVLTVLLTSLALAGLLVIIMLYWFSGSNPKSL